MATATINPAGIWLSKGGSTYSTTLWEKNSGLPLEDRDAFIDVADGDEPIYARVWMNSQQLDKLTAGGSFSNGIVQGAQPVAINIFGYQYAGFTKGGTANGIYASLTVNTSVAANSPQFTASTMATKEMFYVVGARVARQGINTAIYEILLASKAWWWEYKPIYKAYNVLAPNKEQYLSGAQSTTAATPYSSIVTDLAGALGISSNLPTPNLNLSLSGTQAFNPTETGPHNFIITHTPAHRALNQLLQPLAGRLVTNPWGTGSGGDGIEYRIIFFDGTDPGQEFHNLNLLASKALYAGSSNTTYASGSTSSFDPDSNWECLAPEQVQVVCPNNGGYYPTVTSTDPSLYTVVGSTATGAGVGGLGTTDTIFLGGHYVKTGTTGSVGEDLAAIATERMNRYVARQSIVPVSMMFSGPYAIAPGATIRRIRISLDTDEGCITTVWIHGENKRRRQDLDGKFKKFRLPYFTEHLPNSQIMTCPRDDGSMLMSLNIAQVIPATLTNPVGSAGTNIPPAQASLVYDVTDANTGQKMGTGISVWFARQYGHVSPATKGLVGYVGSTLYIFVCDEVIDSGVCTTSP